MKPNSSISIRLIVFGVAVLNSGRSASAGGFPLIGVDFSGTVYDVNPATGATTNARSSGVIPLSGVTLGPNGLLFALNTASGSPAKSLFTIDPVTGSSQLVGGTGLSALFEGDLDFDPTTGILHGLQDAPNAPDPPRSLFVLDTDTGAATLVGSVSGGDLSAMAFDDAGNLWVLNTF